MILGGWVDVGGWVRGRCVCGGVVGWGGRVRVVEVDTCVLVGWCG